MSNIPMQNLPAYYQAMASRQPYNIAHYQDIVIGQNNPREMFAPLSQEANSLPGMVPMYQSPGINNNPVGAFAAGYQRQLSREVYKSDNSQTLSLRGVRGVSGSMMRNVTINGGGYSYPLLGRAGYRLGQTPEDAWYKNPMYLAAGAAVGVLALWFVMKK